MKKPNKPATDEGTTYQMPPQTARPENWIGRSKILDVGPEIAGIQTWGPKTISHFQHDLLAWYEGYKRDLPWRKTRDPYAIWVSEIMLQQTQVDTVIPYYERFMALFPDIQTLSAAPEQTLLKAWEGLGYYSRVRNMQVAAKQMMTDWGGAFPTTYQEIQTLKGIGPYTAGAIASIAFNEPVGAVDGNAMRVLGRLFTINLDIAKAKTQKIYREIMQTLISSECPGDFNQAIMDLGSSYERAQNPDLFHSPIRDYSLGSLTHTALQYPVKKKKNKQKVRHFNALVIENSSGKILITQRIEKGLLQNLWTVPLVEANVETKQKDNEEQYLVVQEAALDYKTSLTETADEQEVIGHVKHVFSHQIWEIDVLRPTRVRKVSKRQIIHPDIPSRYVSLKHVDDTPFPTVQEKIWQQIKDYKEKDRS